GLVTIKHDSEFGFDHAALVQITDAQHEGGLAIQRRDDNGFAENDVRGWSRKTDEDEAGHDSYQKNAAHDFYGRENVAVKTSGRHVPVADGSYRLHAEKEGIEKRSGAHPGHAIVPE